MWMLPLPSKLLLCCPDMETNPQQLDAESSSPQSHSLPAVCPLWVPQRFAVSPVCWLSWTLDRNVDRCRSSGRPQMRGVLLVSPSVDWVVGGTWGTIQQRSSSRLFCTRPLWAVLAWAGMSTLWCWLSSISSADHGVAHPFRYPEGWFWRGCSGVCRARTMQVSISRQLNCQHSTKKR